MIGADGNKPDLETSSDVRVLEDPTSQDEQHGETSHADSEVDLTRPS